MLSDRGIKKSILTYAEVIYLIDQDATRTSCYELAEAHHWAWLVARCCALRPGSLGAPRQHRGAAILRDNGPEFIVWDDVRFIRGEQLGEFTLKLKIRNIKDSSLQSNLDKGVVQNAKGLTSSFTDL